MYHRSRASTLERERERVRRLRCERTEENVAFSPEDSDSQLPAAQTTEHTAAEAEGGGRGGLLDGQVCRLHSWRSRSQPAKTTPAPARDVIANSGRRPLALAHVSTTRSVTSAREVQVAFHGTLSVRFFIA